MAREIDAAQERGEVQTAGGDRKSIIVQTSDNAPASIAALGLDRRRVNEWRDLVEAGVIEKCASQSCRLRRFARSQLL